ncbi:AEC family transporter [Pseudooceanicola sediminis]|uniref:AEC family transporter n=1 Tax=Pseudooceanicola sediminis TaxID=2211117 RepID=A0A399J3H8_9RHOB|nr:AEC family transporter [Pseudooceanicola sediminis]KAA2315163.1 AEC family transporter [Puniceibacterium sp. HSS470]RII39019.1 AEC family transporter [Pseudooceanicola sediminis]|tara:strand:+ start:10817 stop:11749 length:933 start_codon:yes stop_codon:yes gene_type:complete
MSALFNIVLPVFLIIGAGYVTTRMRLLGMSAVEGVLSFTQNFAFPCLLFRAISTFDIGEQFHAPLLLSFYAAATICFVLGLVGARLLGRDAQDSVVIGFCCLFSNSMMLGVPITERAFGPGALGANFAIISVHAPYCYVIGIVAMEYVRAGGTGLPVFALIRRIVRQILSNPLVIALILGFVVNLTHLAIPGPVIEALDMIARAALPSALFAVGGVLVQYKLEGDWRLIGMICLITLLVHPALTWVFGSLGGLDRDAFRSAVLTASVAPGINTYVFANLYDRGKRSAASSLLIATGVCLFTVWFWLSVLP